LRSTITRLRLLSQKAISVILKNHPEHAPGCLRHLHAIGAPVYKKVGKVWIPASSHAPDDSEEPATKRRKEDSDDGVVLVGTRRYAVLSRIPRQYTVIGDLPPHYIIYLLEKAEQLSLNRYQLNKLKEQRPDGKTIQKSSLQELLFRITGWSEDMQLEDTMYNTEALVAMVVKLNTDKKRPLAMVTLPPAWPEVGFYSIESIGTPMKTELVIMNRDTKETATAPRQFVDSIEDLASVFIANNFSEEGADLRAPGCFGKHLKCKACFRPGS